MAGGVAGRLDDLGGEPADAGVVALDERAIDAADASRLLGGGGNAQFGKRARNAGRPWTWSAW